MTTLSIIIYILLPVIVIFGTMWYIRRMREKESGRQPTNKISSVKEEESDGKS